MTSLAVMLSVDSRGPAGLYIATDSRISWQSPLHRWDTSQKAFASRTSADIFGYCGSWYYPPQILSQILNHMDVGLLHTGSQDANARHGEIYHSLRRALESRLNVGPGSFSIFHGARDGEFMASSFRLWHIRYMAAIDVWSDAECKIEADRSYIVHVDGSGSAAIEERKEDWTGTRAQNTSRAAMWTFFDALDSEKDPRSGGAPQLVGIWRRGPAQVFGVIWKDRKYFAGLDVVGGASGRQVCWFNELFERCDGTTGQRLKNAQEHSKKL